MHLAGTLKAFHRVVVAAARIAGKGKDLSIKLLDGGSGCLAWFRGHLEGEFLARVLFHTWATPIARNLFAQCAIPGGDYANYVPGSMFLASWAQVERVVDSSRPSAVS